MYCDLSWAYLGLENFSVPHCRENAEIKPATMVK